MENISLSDKKVSEFIAICVIISYNALRSKAICTLSSVRIEYRIPIPLVVGSNPTGCAKKNKVAKATLFFSGRVEATHNPRRHTDNVGGGVLDAPKRNVQMSQNQAIKASSCSGMTNKNRAAKRLCFCVLSYKKLSLDDFSCGAADCKKNEKSANKRK